MPDTFARDIIVIRNRAGFHVRPITAFVQTATKFKASVKIKFNDQEINGKSVLECTLLAAPYESELHIEAKGEDAEELIQALKELAEQKFGIND